MRADRSLRLPLQIGTSALYSLARGSLLAVPGVILLTIAIVIVLWLPDMGDASGYLFVALATPGGIVGGFAWKHLKRAHSERPSDLLVGRDGFEIHGGPHDQVTKGWAEVKQVLIVESMEQDSNDLRVMTMILTTARIDLASAEREGEKQSLTELALTLQAAANKDTGAPTASKSPDLLVCGGCGAAIAPIDAASVTCPYCTHETAIPETMRMQLRDAATVQRRPDAAIAKLLDQPGASLVGAMFLTAAIFMLVAWPLAILLMTIEFMHGSLTFVHVLYLIAFVASSILGFYALIRVRLVDRQALRLVAVEFAAIEPAKPGEPYRCQRCLAPLPSVAADRVLVNCIYCSAGNVLGIHLGREASIAREESRSLDEAMARRKRERRRWRGVTIVALGLLAGSWWLLRHGMH